MREDRQFVTALARGLEVLRCFTPQRPELGTTEIAAITGLPQPTAWRLCHTLCELGYLLPGHNTEKLRVGPAVLSLGHATITQADAFQFALPLMRDLAEEFEASVSLGARDRLAMVIVQRAESSSVLRLSLHVGSALAIERSALGCAYLAAVAAPERESVIAACARRSPDSGAALRRFLDETLRGYERTGHVLNLRHYHPQVNAVAVPVRSADGSRVLALNCGGADRIVTERKLTGAIAARLKAIAAQIGPLIPAHHG